MLDQNIRSTQNNSRAYKYSTSPAIANFRWIRQMLCQHGAETESSRQSTQVRRVIDSRSQAEKQVVPSENKQTLQRPLNALL